MSGRRCNKSKETTETPTKLKRNMSKNCRMTCKCWQTRLKTSLLPTVGAPPNPPAGRDPPATGPTRRSRSANPNPNTSSPGRLEQPDIEWNRLVIGGWAPDTRRELIIQEATRIVETMQVLDEVKDTIVFGKRSLFSSRVFLSKLPESESSHGKNNMGTSTSSQALASQHGLPPTKASKGDSRIASLAGC